MREKYESLSLAILKDLAKARGMKRISTLKKAELIERMVQQDAEDAKAAAKAADTQSPKAAVDSGVQREERKKPEERENNKEAVQAPVKRRGRPPKNKAPETEAPVKAADTPNKGTYARPTRKSGRMSAKYNAQHQGKDSSGDRTRDERTHGMRENASENRNHGKREFLSEERAAARRENGSEEHGYPRHDTSSDERRGQANDTFAGQESGADTVREDVKYHGDKREHMKPARPERRPRPVIVTGDAETDEKLKSVDDRTLQRIETEGVTLDDLDSGIDANGILEVMPDGYGFIRCENYLPGDNDIYVAPSQIRRFKLKTGDILTGHTRVRSQNEKFSALLYIGSVNGINPTVASRRIPFEDLTPIFPNERLRLETSSSRVSMRILDLIAPVGKGQRGMIVSQPKAGKTTLLKEIAKSIKKNNPEMHLIILLIDERPEEVTDIKEAIEGENVEVIYSTFDELPEHHKRVSEMVIERAKRLVEHKQDVMILLDSITRLARAYNMVVPPSGRTLSGGLDPTALHMPKRFFGAARNMREGGSLTILATALVDTGSRMDDVVYEEFKGTGNMELILDRKLSEKRIFPAIDIVKSGTRRDDLLLDKEEQEAVEIMRRSFNGMKSDDAVEAILRMFLKTRTNYDFIRQVLHRKFF